MADAYEGPRIVVTEIVKAQIAGRSRPWINRQVESHFRLRQAEWAASDSGPYPDMDQIRAELHAELEVLCHGLGHWSAVDPDDYFRTAPNPFGR